MSSGLIVGRLRRVIISGAASYNFQRNFSGISSAERRNDERKKKMKHAPRFPIHAREEGDVLGKFKYEISRELGSNYTTSFRAREKEPAFYQVGARELPVRKFSDLFKM